MDKDTLRKVQLIQLEIVKEIDRVCEENGISYFLVGGSLLGAIRHKGFIPWDDDLDIGMLRKDYERFRKIAPQFLIDKYRMIDWKKDSNYPHPMCKIIKKGTIYKENKRNDAGEQGIWVDVFPYDNVNIHDNSIKYRMFKLKMLRSLIRAKNNYQTWQKNNGIIVSKYLKNIPFRVVSVFFNREKLIKTYELISMIDEGKDCDFVYENGTEDYEKWFFPKEYFANLRKKEFEKYQLSIPQKYDEYLKIAYGDYMQLPPIENRENRHLIEEVNVGDE